MISCSGSLLDARLLLPDRKGPGASNPILGGTHPMSTLAEMLVKGTVRGEKALRLAGGLEALHVPFSLTRGRVRVLGSVVEVAALQMRDPGQNIAFRGRVTLQFICHGETRHIA
jgi:hypothetical protein